MRDKKEILQIFPNGIREMLKQQIKDLDRIQEIRMRILAPFFVKCQNQEILIRKEGGEAYLVTKKDIRETVEGVSCYSLYAFEDELRQGFITIPGGHRIGLAGKTVTESGRIRTMKFISFLNIRMAHEVKGCADSIMPFLYQKEREDIYSVMIISPPGGGKTTLLRDMIRQISNGTGRRKGIPAAVIDERSEIAACYQGEPQNEVGIRTDVFDCCPKAEGMMMAIRTMSPKVVAADEIGSRKEVEAVRYAAGCGCRLAVTIHGESLKDIQEKPVLKTLFEEGIFQRYVLLDGKGHAGHVAGIYDERGKRRDAYG